jgi:hypothetical protein
LELIQFTALVSSFATGNRGAEPGGLPPSAEALRDAPRIYEIEVIIICDPTCHMRSGDFILSIGPLQ